MSESISYPGHLFIVGPPGAGKTTLGRAMAAHLKMAYYQLDRWAGIVYPLELRTQPMTDEQVARAVTLMFGELGPSPAVWEFAHHDYIRLLATNRYPSFTDARKLIVFADIETCLSRNAARRSPVRSAYIERAWRSTRDLIALQAAGSAGNEAWGVNTTITPMATALVAALNFLDSENKS